MTNGTPIKVLELPTVIWNRLRQNGITTVEDLQSKTQQELLAIRTIGVTKIEEINLALAAFGKSAIKDKPPIVLINPLFFQELGADKLERLRDKARERHRITYDCFNTIVRGDQVSCKTSHALNSVRKDGSITLLSVLKGRSSKACLSCLDYDDDEGEANAQ